MIKNAIFCPDQIKGEKETTTIKGKLSQKKKKKKKKEKRGCKERFYGMYNFD